jgi:hypothetical protein
MLQNFTFFPLYPSEEIMHLPANSAASQALVRTIRGANSKKIVVFAKQLKE